MAKIYGKEVEKALHIYGKELVNELSNQLIKLDKKASGKLIRSIDYRLRPLAHLIIVEIRSEDYLKYVDGGRKPGKQPPLKAIQKWTRLKGINTKASYPIARHIGRFGIKPTHVIEKTVKALERGRAARKLEEGMSDWVDNQVDDLLINVSKKGNIVFRP